MIGLCAAGMVFNLRFLAALFAESKVRPVVHQMRMKLNSGEVPVQASTTLRYTARQMLSLVSRF